MKLKNFLIIIFVISVSCLICCPKSDQPLEVLGEIHKGKIVSIEQGFHLDALKKCNVVIEGEDEYSICVIVPPSVCVEEGNEIYFYEVPVEHRCGEKTTSSKIGFFIPGFQAEELGY